MSLSHVSFIAPNPVSNEITVLTAGSHATSPGHRIGAQVIDFCLIHHVVSGQGTFHCSNRQYTVGAGSSFFIFPNELVSYEASADSPWHYYWIGFKSASAYKLLGEMGLSPEMAVADLTGKQNIPNIHRLIEQHFLDPSPFAKLNTEAYTQLLLAEYGKSLTLLAPQTNSNVGAGTIDKAIRWMNAHYHETISIERLASSIGYHRAHMSKLFS